MHLPYAAAYRKSVDSYNVGLGISRTSAEHCAAAFAIFCTPREGIMAVQHLK